MSSFPNISRREAIRFAALSAAGWMTPGVFAEQLATPSLTEGPFYPDKLPLDTDNDLIIVNDAVRPAIGEITHLSGVVSDLKGNPLRNAFIEIWQVDNNGVYLHSRSDGSQKRDSNFQGYGRFLTDSKGQYYFRTVKPVPYPGRTPHIHLAVSQNGRRLFTTQLLIKGHPQNERDGVFNDVRDPKLRELLLVNFNPLEGSKIGELTARFDVILGATPVDNPDKISGGIGKPEGGGPGAGPGGPGRPPRGRPDQGPRRTPPR